MVGDSWPNAAATACAEIPRSVASVECNPLIPCAVTTGTFAALQILLTHDFGQSRQCAPNNNASGSLPAINPKRYGCSTSGTS
ncbi:MAG: hypothetical protein WCG85_11770 [Polyangia bacterium]